MIDQIQIENIKQQKKPHLRFVQTAKSTIEANKLTIAYLEGEIQRLKQVLALTSKTDAQKELKEIAATIRSLTRAAKGLSETDDIYYGLIDQERIEERTRLDDANAESHGAMRCAAQKWPVLDYMADLADMEDHYFISGDNESGGLGRREAILMRQAQTKAEGNMILNLPNPSGGTAQTEQAQAQQPQKKNIFQRILRR